MRMGLYIFALFVLGLLILMFLGQNNQTYTGDISSIKYSEKTITLSLENNSIQFIIFTNKILNISERDKISITGRTEEYKGNAQIIVDQIIKIVQ